MNTGFHASETEKISQSVNLEDKLSVFFPGSCSVQRSNVPEKDRTCVFFPPCRYSKEQQALLVQNVFLTGGNAMYPGLKARVQKELLEMRPFQSSFQVHILMCFHEHPLICV